MKYIDMHCDSLMKTAGVLDPKQTIYDNQIAQVDCKSLLEAGCLLQFFAIFLLDESYYHYVDVAPLADDDYIHLLSQHLKEQIQKHSNEIGLVLSYNDIIKNKKLKKLSALLTLEDGRSLEGDLDKLDDYYDLGIRLIGLSWNKANCIGFPNSTDAQIMKKGLTPFGKDLIKKMNHLGILVDVSHLSDGGFYDVAALSEKPFIASHSNARSVTDHPRNLSDQMIKIIADQGGVIGLNFAPQFLQSKADCQQSNIKDMVRHLNYIKDVGGCDVLAIGTDFDGVEGEFEINQPQEMNLLFEALDQANWSADLIEKFAYKNILAVLKEVL